MSDENKVVTLTPQEQAEPQKEPVPWERIKDELADIVSYVNEHLSELDARTRGADFQRGHYEARHWLLSQKIAALNSLMKLNTEVRKLSEKEEKEEFDSIADLLG